MLKILLQGMDREFMLKEAARCKPNVQEYARTGHQLIKVSDPFTGFVREVSELAGVNAVIGIIWVLTLLKHREELVEDAHEWLENILLTLDGNFCAGQRQEMARDLNSYVAISSREVLAETTPFTAGLMAMTDTYGSTVEFGALAVLEILRRFEDSIGTTATAS